MAASTDKQRRAGTEKQTRGFHEAVQVWVRKLITNSAEALGLAKIAIDAAVDSDRRTARHIDRMANTQLLQTQEHLDKIEAFKNRSKG